MYYSTSLPDLVVEIKATPRHDGSYTIVGHAIDRETDARIEDLAPIRRMARSKGQLPAVRNQIISTLTRRYETLHHSTDPPGDIMTEIKSALTQLQQEVAGGMRLTPRWAAESTNAAALKYFTRNTINILKPYLTGEREYLPSDCADIELALTVSVSKTSPDNIIPTEGEPFDSSTLPGSTKILVKRRLDEANVIMARLEELIPQLPHFRLECTFEGEGAILPEQRKSLPHDVFRTFIKKLESRIDTHPDLVFCAVHMVYGCRTGEAAARIPEDVTLYDDFAVAKIISQEIDGLRTARLKTHYSRRTIVISYWGRTTLARCIALLPPTTNSKAALVHKDDLGHFIKALLLEAGAQEEDFEVAKKEMDSLSEHTDKSLPEVTAYILRRHFASVCRHIMGLPLAITDRLLGHPASGAVKDLKNVEVQREIAMAMERYVFDPASSLNPACRPITLAANADIVLTPFSESIICNPTEQEIEIEISIASAEGAETVILDTPAEAEISAETHNSVVSWDGIDRLVIGDGTPRKDTHDET